MLKLKVCKIKVFFKVKNFKTGLQKYYVIYLYLQRKILIFLQYCKFKLFGNSHPQNLTKSANKPAWSFI